jgi:DNA-binding NtrC family response regulator
MAKSFGLQQEHEKLVLDILRYVIGKDPISKVPFPEDLVDYQPFIVQLFEGRIIDDPYPQPSPGGRKESQPQGSSDVPVNISEKELLGRYYRALLKEAGGVKKKAADRAGLRPDNFRKRLIKWGITE